MNLDLKTRIVRLHIKQNDIAKMLSGNGFPVHPAELSDAIHAKNSYPKTLKIQNDLKNLLTRLEHERGLD